MLNRFRHVRSDHDDYNSWQCLKCREQFAAPSTHNWKFCPLCGTCWEGQLEWEKPYYQISTIENPYTWVIQERSIFRHADGESITEWKDTYKNLQAWLWGRWTKASDVFEMWNTEIAFAQSDLLEEKKRHIRYCEHMGKHEPFRPFSIQQLRLVVRKNGQPDKIIKEYLPTYQEGKPSMVWLD